MASTQAAVAAHSRHESQILQSFPTEKSSTDDPVSFYNIYWYPADELPGIIVSQKHFQAQHTDVILATAPKSGTTWLKSLVFAIAKRTRYPISDPNHPLLVTIYSENHFPEISIPPPRLISVHVPYSMLPESIVTSNSPIIYMCRDPKDIFVLMWHFGNKLLPQPVPLSEAFDRFCKGLAWYGPCWDQSLEYWKMSLKRPEKVLFLKYKELKGDITSQVKKMAEHLGCPFSVEEEEEGVIDGIVRTCGFEHLKDLQVNKIGE